VSTLAEAWPYLVFASLHLVAGQGLATLIYRARFGGSPLVLYAAGAAGEHGRRTRWVAVATTLWVSAFVAALLWPAFGGHVLGAPLLSIPAAAGWIVGGVGLVGMLAAQVGMGAAFRVGQDHNETPALVTTGLHSRSRNPVYVFSMLYLFGVSLWVPCPAVLAGLVALAVGIHRLVLTEERFLAASLGPQVQDYYGRVRRYL